LLYVLTVLKIRDADSMACRCTEYYTCVTMIDYRDLSRFNEKMPKEDAYSPVKWHRENKNRESF